MPIDPAVASPSDVYTRRAARHELRRETLARRMALSEEDHIRQSYAVRGHLLAGFPQLAAMRVGFCWPISKEPDLRPAIEIWRAAGKTAFAALLPVVIETGAALAFRRWLPDTAMTEDRYGIPTPTAGDFAQPQALLIPLIAFDAVGFRLGYGGGYFDRTLARLRPRPLAIGVGFELCRVGGVYPEPHDERLDAAVTEAGISIFSRKD